MRYKVSMTQVIIIETSNEEISVLYGLIIEALKYQLIPLKVFISQLFHTVQPPPNASFSTLLHFVIIDQIVSYSLSSVWGEQR